MIESPNLIEIFGSEAIETSEFIQFSKSELSRIKLDNFTFDTVLVGIHELLKRTFSGYMFDDSNTVLEDGKDRIITDYNSYYDLIKCVFLGKEVRNENIVFAYKWHILTEVTLTGSINDETDLIVINEESIVINKQSLGTPNNVIEFIYGFLTYINLFYQGAIKIVLDNFVEITLLDNYQFDLDEVI